MVTPFASAVAPSDGPARPAQEPDPASPDGVILEPAEHPMSCLGDINGDGVVEQGDLAVLLANWSLNVPVYHDGDLNGDGVVGQADLAVLLSLYGQPCLPVIDAMFELVEGGLGPAEDDSDPSLQLTWCRYTLRLVQGRNCGTGATPSSVSAAARPTMASRFRQTGTAGFPPAPRPGPLQVPFQA